MMSDLNDNMKKISSLSTSSAEKIAESLATFKFVVLISFINAVNKVRRHTLLHCININT